MRRCTMIGEAIDAKPPELENGAKNVAFATILPRLGPA